MDTGPNITSFVSSVDTFRPFNRFFNPLHQPKPPTPFPLSPFICIHRMQPILMTPAARQSFPAPFRLIQRGMMFGDFARARYPSLMPSQAFPIKNTPSFFFAHKKLKNLPKTRQGIKLFYKKFDLSSRQQK